MSKLMAGVKILNPKGFVDALNKVEAKQRAKRAYCFIKKCDGIMRLAGDPITIAMGLSNRWACDKCDGWASHPEEILETEDEDPRPS